MRVPLVIHFPWKEKWLGLWIYMDSWAATWKEPAWKIKDKDAWGRSIGMSLWEWAQACSSFLFFKKKYLFGCAWSWLWHMISLAVAYGI